MQVAARFEKLLEVETPGERSAEPERVPPSPVPGARQPLVPWLQHRGREVLLTVPGHVCSET